MQYPEGRLQYELREGAPKHYKEMKMNQVIYAMTYLKIEWETKWIKEN